MLFLMHFFAFGVLGALAFGREVQKLVEANGARGRALGYGAVMAVPFILPVAYLFVGLAAGPENPAGSYSEVGSWIDRAVRLQTPLYTWATDLTANLNVTAFFILVCLYGTFATTLFKTRWGLQVAPVMRGPLLALFAVVFLSPNWLSGVALINLRFPWVFILVMIAACEFRVPLRRHAVVIVMVLVATMGVRSGQVGTWWAAHDADIQDLTSLVGETVAPGERLLPVRAPGAFNDSRQWHVQAYATATRDAFIPTLFQGVHAVQLRNEWRNHATPLMHANPACALFEDAAKELFRDRLICRAEPYTDDWGRKFDKLLAMEPLPEELLEGQPLTRVGQKGRYEMYEITAPIRLSAVDANR